MASCGGEILEESFGDKKLAFVPGRKPKDMSETIIAVAQGGSERTSAVAGRARGLIAIT